MNTDTAVRAGDHILSDADRLRLARSLAAAALPRSRTLCLAWIDVEQRFSGIAVPVRNVPDRPHDDDAARFGMVVASVSERSVPYGSVVAVYVRPDGDGITDADRAWNRALREQAATHGFRFHGLFVSGGGGVRPLTLDDAE